MNFDTGDVMINNNCREILVSHAHKLGMDGVIDFLLANARECVYLLPGNRYAKPADAREKESRIGGLPCLTSSHGWPRASLIAAKAIEHWQWSDRLQQEEAPKHAAFLAQLALDMIPDFEDNPFPRQGLLSLFLISRQPYGEVTIGSCYSKSVNETSPRKDPDERLRPVVRRPTEIRFQVGVSVPYGHKAFREQLFALLQEDGLGLARALIPEDCIGQLGGYAYTEYGVDICRDTVLARLGKRKMATEMPYNSIAELEHSIQASHRPSMDIVPLKFRSKNPRDQYDRLRSEAKWMEENAMEISSWRPLVKLNSNMWAGFDLGGGFPFWIIGRSNDVTKVEGSDLFGVLGS